MEHLSCWLLTSVRSGSWYLCEILNKTGVFPITFGEYMHWNYPLREPYPTVCKVLRRHFLSYHSDQDKLKILRRLPGVKFILLQRDDHIARASSLYYSLVTREWRDSDHDQDAPIDNQMLLRCYAEVSESKFNCWDEFLSGLDHVVVNYEDLVSKPLIVANKILGHLGLAELKSLPANQTRNKVHRQKNKIRKRLEFLLGNFALIPSPEESSCGDVYDALRGQ